MLPNLIIAGAPKCGSTTLYHLLSQHPDIIMSTPKEPSIFLNNWGDSISSYSKFFPEYNNQKYIGEASVKYFAFPEVVKRISTYVPEAKIIFILRDPAERCYSHYWQRVRLGRESRSFKEVIQSGDEEYLFQYSFYYKCVSSYLEFIPKENVHIVILEDLKTNQELETQNIFKFLKVNSSFQPKIYSTLNQGHAVRSRLMVKGIRKLRESSFMFKSFLQPVGSRVLRLFEKYNKTALIKDYKVLEANRTFLKEKFQDDVNKLEILIERKLPWLP